MKLTPIQFRILGWVIVGVLAAGAVALYLKNRDDNAATERSAEQGVRTDQAASGIAQDAQTETTETQRVEVIVTEARGAYQRGYEDAKRDPAVRSWADQPIPQRLRDLARERRVARERSGCAGDGCPGDDAAARDRAEEP